jgi:DNA topoisomerase-1
VVEADRLHGDARASAELAGLVYVEGVEPGISRRRRGKSFRYLSPNGKLVSQAESERIAALAIPPAWREVWIGTDPDGHLLATGFDARGRKQYLYHPMWRQVRDRINFSRLVTVGASLRSIRRHVAGELRRRTLDRDRVLATMVRITDVTGIRIGGEIYARANDSYGLTTLVCSHVSVTGERVQFRFPAKSGKRAVYDLHDAAVARTVRELQGRPRRRLFVADGRPVRPEDINGLLAELSGEHLTAKDFRTWRGTVTALGFLRGLPAGHRPTKRHVLEALDAAAEDLSNTRSIARGHYVLPELLDAYLDGSLATFPAVRGRDALLSRDERVLIAILPDLLAR